MKIIFLLTSLLVAQYQFGQVTKSLNDFSSLKTFDKLKINLVQSNENKIEIKGERESEVETVINKDKELKIRMPFPKLLSGNEVSITLYFKHLETISACEGSIISCSKNLEQEVINLTSKEGGIIKVKIDADKVNLKAVSGGIIEVSGKTSTETVYISSGGVIEAKNLVSLQADASITAGGNAEINAKDLVNAKVNAGGTILIYGNPKEVNQKTTLGGTIIVKQKN